MSENSMRTLVINRLFLVSTLNSTYFETRGDGYLLCNTIAVYKYMKETSQCIFKFLRCKIAMFLFELVLARVPEYSSNTGTYHYTMPAVRREQREKGTKAFRVLIKTLRARFAGRVYQVSIWLTRTG